jgi:hypothetical protein
MKSTTVRTLNQEAIPTIPFIKPKLFAAMYARLNDSSCARIMRKIRSRVTGIGTDVRGRGSGAGIIQCGSASLA